MAPLSRKILRLTVVGLLSEAFCYTADAFVAPSPSYGSSRSSVIVSRGVLAQTSSLRLRATSIKNTNASPPNLPRLTAEEQQELLQKAVQARSIKEVETKLALQSATTLKARQAELSREFGYTVAELAEMVYQGQLARETLVTRNMGLVHYTVNDIIGKQKSKCQTLSREDLVQEGAIGLSRAVDRWNPDIGGKFSTYAMYWIRALILRCIAERDDIVRVPEHVSSAVRKVTRAAQTLGLDIDGDNILSHVYSSSASSAPWKEAQAAKALAEAAGLTDKQFAEVMKVRRRRRGGMISFESWMQQGKDYVTDLSPVTEQEDAPSLASVETELMVRTLSKFLRPREIEALSWRYGLNSEVASTPSASRDYVAKAEERLFGSASPSPPSAKEMPVRGKWGEAMSFVEVGKRMQVSDEYGRRLCHAALNKLRQAADEGSLEPSLFSA
jgi:RNA polymerase sigma factor (sigma-70 family)